MSTIINSHRSRMFHAIASLGLATALALCGSASAAKFVDLPSSANASEPLLTMSGSGRYAITWRQQPPNGVFERVYVQAGGVSRPFRSKPTSPGRADRLIGPLETATSSGSDGLAWLGKTDPGAKAAFVGPRTTRMRTVAFVESTNSIVVATISKTGTILSRRVAHVEPSTAEFSNVGVAVDGLGNPTVHWIREPTGCAGDSFATSPALDCIPGALYVASAIGAGPFTPPQLVAADCEQVQLIQASTGAATMIAQCANKPLLTYRAPGGLFSSPIEMALNGAQAAGHMSITRKRRGRLLVAYEVLGSIDATVSRASILVATGPIGQPLAAPVTARRNLRIDTSNNPSPTPQLITTKRGRTYLRWFQGRRTRLAIVKSTLRLGKPVVVPGFDRRALNTMDAEVAVTDRGMALAVWNFISVRTNPAVRATKFRAPSK
ncbi:MAG: hypothetical protein ACPGYP_04070 [Solirubrobacterales bacterium]